MLAFGVLHQKMCSDYELWRLEKEGLAALSGRKDSTLTDCNDKAELHIPHVFTFPVSRILFGA